MHYPCIIQQELEQHLRPFFFMDLPAVVKRSWQRQWLGKLKRHFYRSDQVTFLVNLSVNPKHRFVDYFKRVRLDVSMRALLHRGGITD